MANSLRIIILFLTVIIFTSTTYAQPNDGSYLHLDNTVYYDNPSAIDLSFIKENKESISVLFSTKHVPKEMRGFINGLESSFKNRLLRDGFTLQGRGSAKNDIELWVDVLNHDNHASYLVRLLVLKDVNYNENKDWNYQSLIIWQRMFQGYGTKSNLKTKINSNISAGLNQLIKELNTEL